jgi:hypothetical protein
MSQQRNCPEPNSEHIMKTLFYNITISVSTALFFRAAEGEMFLHTIMQIMNTITQWKLKTTLLENINAFILENKTHSQTIQ